MEEMKAMVSPQQHHHHGDQDTDECILLREEDKTISLYSFSIDSLCFWSRMVCTLARKRWYHLRVQSSFFCEWCIFVLSRENIIASPNLSEQPLSFPTSISVDWSHDDVTLEFRFHFLLLLGQLFFVWPEILNLAAVHFVAFRRLGISPESDSGAKRVREQTSFFIATCPKDICHFTSTARSVTFLYTYRRALLPLIC